MTKIVLKHSFIRLAESARRLVERVVPGLRRAPGRRRCVESWNQRTAGYPVLSRRGVR
jgi:hypothetical protein